MNRLADETSPYLRQHRDNPVDWYAWGPEAFAAATERNVPVLLSIGYSACHWCHVMAHECFEDAEVAALMNDMFVNIKVDREERPDVDSLYMDAVQAMTGRGGWPMTVFLSPDGTPFYGGTYFPKDGFLKLLPAIDEVFRTRPDDVAKNAKQMMKAIDATAQLAPGKDIPTVEQLNTAVQTLGRAFDRDHGGFGKEPKFPSTFNIELMLRAYMTSGSSAAREVIVTTLDAMAAGGMFDHIGGGFARYSTDRQWHVPHFEKMLYDQALLAQTYLHAIVVLREPQWRQVIQDTIEYVLGTLTHPEGGFYSAEDADSLDAHGASVEGAFYTWTPDEVRAALGNTKPEIVEQALAYWDITDEGNWHESGPVGDRAGDDPGTTTDADATEGADADAGAAAQDTAEVGPIVATGRSIPNRIAHRDDLVRPDAMSFVRTRLLEARSTRPRPGLDDKVLLEWNALFLSALSQAAAVFNHQPWLDAAELNAEFLIDNMRGGNGRWYRSWQENGNPPARHDALAADHAALIDAFTRLAEATGKARWIAEARATADTLLDWFFDPGLGGLYTTAEDGEHLISRQKDISDNATPSANSMAAIALQRLAALTGELRYANHAERILQLLAPQVDDKVGMFSHALLAADLMRRGTTEVVIAGGTDGDGAEHDMADFVRVAHSIWRPDAVLAWGEPYDSPLWEDRTPGFAYVCKDHVCSAPSATTDEFVSALTGGALAKDTVTKAADTVDTADTAGPDA
ncbi:MAG: thioredoxin domain-containing protein [Ilumatobacter sp.]|uniref:thioredoxin domain-containing protein n=1 Tax=Ilumatobacter sp. TaxID=1967498 RepID=UPI0032978108